MEYKSYRIEEFINDLSSCKATPGGGSVAGLVSALAGSLNSMVYSLTVNKKAFEKMDLEDKKLVLDFKEASTKFVKKSLVLMEKDRNAFNSLMDCYSMPKETEEQVAKRNKAIEEKTIGAMMAPYELTKEAYKFFDNIDIAVKYGNKMVLSDAFCAAILLSAAIECSIENVKINLKSINNKEYREKITNEIEEIKNNSFERKNKILNG
ncbi:MAG: cyclodeaminase/cyclohydrolase family protein [Clostridiales bacterium]|nr:cyclodeaminase/cyclohydrolase family protein [Clostridiales bacterium]